MSWDLLLFLPWAFVFYIMWSDLIRNQEEKIMAMSGAKHHSKTLKVLMKTLHKCNEIVEVKETSHGWTFVASNGETFGHHPTSKTCHKLRSWLRKNTKLAQGIIVKITKS